MKEMPAVKSVSRGTLSSVIVTLILVLLFALVLNVTDISGGVIKPVTQIIKVLSVFTGTLIALRGVRKLGWLYGIIVGILYTALTYFIFSILYNDFTITVGLLNDMIFASAVAVISALIVRFAKGA